MAILETKFDFDKLKAAQQLALESSQKERQARNFFIIISFLSVFVGVIIFLFYRRKRRDNFQLTAQKEEILQKNNEIENRINEIAAQKEEIQAISDKLHQTDQMKLRFFSNISHEIRTPLMLILGPLQKLIRQHNKNDELSKTLKVIQASTLRLNELTSQILDLQKLDSGKLRLNPEKDDIVKILRETVSGFEALSEKNGYELVFSSPHTAVYCSFDRDKLTKMVSNLLSNAFKFNREGGKIGLDLDFPEGQIAICISDQGQGIPEEHVKDVFKRYYQLESSNTRYEGTGIGLAYVKELAGLMNGTVEISSEVGTGTKVCLKVPVDGYDCTDPKTCRYAFTPGKASEKLNAVMFAEHTDNPENISTMLIVEDNDDLRLFIGDNFKSDFQVIYAKDGSEGIRQAKYYLPDIIISDIMMPHTSGIEMAKALKNDTHTSHIPILFLTAKDTPANIQSGYCSGADDYIVKPFDHEVLKMKVRNICQTMESARKRFDPDPDRLKETAFHSSLDIRFLKKCYSVIRKNLENSSFSVEEMAAELGFSRRNLYRKLQALTSYSPAELIRDLRLKQAVTLLKNTDLRIYEIALATGYEDASRFSQTFKKQYGVLPSKYHQSS
jgi:signal transduction histidine kinase/DNA-binding response OmpR family regulator